MKTVTLNLIFLLMLSCKPSADPAIAAPKIKAGTAKLTGKIISPKEKREAYSTVDIFVPHPISGEIFNYKATTDQSGRFSININMETDVSLIALYTSLKPHNSIILKVRSGDVTNVNITYNLELVIKDVQTMPNMDKYEMMGSVRIINEMLGIYDSFPEPQIALYDKSPAAYPNYVKARVSEKLKILNKDSLLSKELKEILAKDFTIWRFRLGIFDYEKSMKFNFKRTAKDTTIMPEIQQIDRTYFGFIKDFNLNDPQYLVCSSFPDFQNEVLKNNILALPEIAEHDIPSWLAGVKDILSDVVGFRDGQYYDILAANAYGRQLIHEARPLTEKQKKNIAGYWKEGEITKILMRKNQQVISK